MPNKRKPGKKKLAIWLTDGEIEQVKTISQFDQLTMTDSVRNMIAHYYKKVTKMRKRSEVKKANAVETKTKKGDK